MSSTRYRQQPLQIYQDPISFDRASIPTAIKNNAKTTSPLRPIKDASSRKNVVLNPPTLTISNLSPLKPVQQNSSSPLRAALIGLGSVSMTPPRGLNFQTDSLEKKQPMMSKFKTASQKPLFSSFSTQYPTGKENYPTPIHPAPTHPSIQPVISMDGVYGQKPSNKRVLLESASIQESRPSKKLKAEKEKDSEPEVAAIPSPDQFPALRDDGTKPQHSYAMLIGMAILRTPSRRLTLAQIYKWISDTYSYYNVADAGWQNSIRHNLSLNKAFVKQERPKDDPGKGNYWAIEPGMEQQFVKEKQVRRQAGVILENGPIASITLAPAPIQEAMQSSYRTMTPAPQELPPSSSFMANESIARPVTEPSSDATIPASDAFNPEDQEEDESYLAPHYSRPMQSSPPAMMHSSPPVARVHRRDDTPPPVPRFPTSSRTRSHKRNFASMDDSGYFSSLNSSVTRGHRGDHGQLISEADRPRKGIKRGRAEEEIARLRGSSYDSPTKAPSFRHSVSFVPPSSSPIRRGLVNDNSQMLPPLTPAVKLRAPPRPPPSVSPNTNLRLHRDRVRQLVGSPDRGLGCLEDQDLPWSPAFHIEDTSYLNADFDIFSDINANIFLIPGNGSPEKRSTQRPRMERAHSTSVLGDITNTNYNKNITSTPTIKFTPVSAPAFDSPCKQFNQGSSLKFGSPLKFDSPTLNPYDPSQEDFCGAEFLTDELTEFSGMDIMQGFQKIGSGHGGSKSQNPRPTMGRSFSTRF